MLIQCTKKLLTELKVAPETDVGEVDPLFGWHANLLMVNRRKTVIFVNDACRYTIILYGLKAKDFKNIQELFSEAIREIFQKEQIREEVINAYLSKAGKVTLSKTGGSTYVARLNTMAKYATFREDRFSDEYIFQLERSFRTSRLLAGSSDSKDYFKPNEALYEKLTDWYGGPIFNREGIALRVTMAFMHHEVWRKIIVPKEISLYELHEVLQIVFDWKNQHMYEFNIYPSKPSGSKQRNVSEYVFSLGKPKLNLIPFPEMLNENLDYLQGMVADEKLIDHLPSEIVYTYDLGDDWKHLIQVEEFVDDYGLNYATCVDGSGNAPPEDVGGEGGFHYFLEVINDKSNEEYEHLSSWGRMQGYSEFNIDMINRQLKNK